MKRIVSARVVTESTVLDVAAVTAHGDHIAAIENRPVAPQPEDINSLGRLDGNAQLHADS